MALVSERFASRRDTLAFVLCLALAVVARMAPPAWGEALASGIRGTLLAPFLALERQAELTRTARARFAAVVAQRDSAVLLAGRIDALEAENRQLRDVIGLSKRLPVRHIPAEVLHQSFPTDGYSLVLSAGRSDGVAVMAPVLAPEGLLGVVSSVERRTSVVVAWSHPDFRASAMTADGSAFGIVAPVGSDGPNRMLLALQGVPYGDRVGTGSLVYTSGLGGVYPRGVPIGRVLAVGEEEVGWSRTYLVQPAVHPASVSHAMVLTMGVREDLRPSFENSVP